jgi:hypothetical protein
VTTPRAYQTDRIAGKVQLRGQSPAAVASAFFLATALALGAGEREFAWVPGRL